MDCNSCWSQQIHSKSEQALTLQHSLRGFRYNPLLSALQPIEYLDTTGKQMLLKDTCSQNIRVKSKKYTTPLPYSWDMGVSRKTSRDGQANKKVTCSPKVYISKL